MSRRRPRKPKEPIVLSGQQAAEFLGIVRDDLIFLTQLDYEAPTRTTVRVMSGILRRLFHEPTFLSAWQSVGIEHEPKITATDLEAMIEGIPRKYIHYAYAGGAGTRGAHHSGFMMAAVPKAEALVVPKVEPEALDQTAIAKKLRGSFKPGRKREFPLEAFLNSPAIISGNAAVSRIGVVRYVANKLGGVHFDHTRKAWIDPVGSRHRLLDEIHTVVGRLPAPMFEVASIAQAVATSADTNLLIEAINKAAPDDGGDPRNFAFREGRIGKYATIKFTLGETE